MGTNVRGERCVKFTYNLKYQDIIFGLDVYCGKILVLSMKYNIFYYYLINMAEMDAD